MAVSRVVSARYACALPATTHTQAGRIRTAIISHAVPPVRYRTGGEGRPATGNVSRYLCGIITELLQDYEPLASQARRTRVCPREITFLSAIAVHVMLQMT